MAEPQDEPTLESEETHEGLWAGWASLQQAQLLGSYQPNNSILRLEADASFWSAPQDDRLLERYATFVHEYAHYLHNYSTVAGITDFCCHLYAAYYFILANTPRGRCQGSRALTPTDLARYRRLMALQQHIRGEVHQPDSSKIHGDHANYRTLRLMSSTFASPLLAEPMQRMDVVMEVTSRRGEPVEVSFALGYRLIDEAIAYNLEKLIFERAGKPTQTLEASTPSFPYKILETLIRDCTKVAPTAEQIIKIGLLALQHTDCGWGMRQLLKQLKEDPAGFAPTLDHLTRKTMAQVTPEVSSLFAQLVDPAVKNFSGLLGEGVRYHRQLCDSFLRERQVDPFFELDLAGIRADNTAQFKDFVDRFPPCPILEMRNGQAHDMYFLASTEPGEEHTHMIAAFQAFGTYQRWHLSRSGVVPTNSLPDLPCTYSGYCAVPFARDHPTVCRTKPWNSYDPTAAKLCWFATAVANARSRPPSAPPTGTPEAAP